MIQLLTYILLITKCFASEQHKPLTRSETKNKKKTTTIKACVVSELSHKRPERNFFLNHSWHITNGFEVHVFSSAFFCIQISFEILITMSVNTISFCVGNEFSLF